MILRGARRFDLGWSLVPSLLLLAGCATMDGAAQAACPESQAMQVEDFPASVLLPSGSIIEQQTHGHPPEYASDNYAVVAQATGSSAEVSAFYRCMLPRRNLSVISEEKGNVLLIRFAGEAIDDGSIALSDGAESGGTRIEIFVIEKERPDSSAGKMKEM